MPNLMGAFCWVQARRWDNYMFKTCDGTSSYLADSLLCPNWPFSENYPLTREFYPGHKRSTEQSGNTTPAIFTSNTKLVTLEESNSTFGVLYGNIIFFSCHSRSIVIHRQFVSFGKMSSLTWWIILLVAGCATVRSDDERRMYNLQSKLRAKLLSGYDIYTDPRRNKADSVEVNFGLSLQAIEHMDENQEILTTSCWINMRWKDERLRWNQSDYPGVSSLRFPVKSVWRPDILPYNAASEPYESPSVVPLVLTSDGGISFIEHNRLRTTCPVDMRRFPFDEQSCRIKFGSWTNDGGVLNVTKADDKIDVSTYLPNREWDLIDTSVDRHVFKYDCCPESYVDVTMTVRMKRRSGLLFHLYVGPTVCFALLVPVVFILPADSNQKLVLGGSLLISQVLMQTMLSQSMPLAQLAPPLLALYLLANSVLLALSLAFSSVIINLWNRSLKTGNGVPTIVKRIFLGLFGRLCCVRLDEYIETSAAGSGTNDDLSPGPEDGTKIVNQYSRMTAPAEWRQLAVILDRMLFVIFLFCTLVLMFAMIPFK